MFGLYPRYTNAINGATDPSIIACSKIWKWYLLIWPGPPPIKDRQYDRSTI